MCEERAGGGLEEKQMFFSIRVYFMLLGEHCFHGL